MGKKTLILLLIALGIIGVVKLVLFSPSKSPLSNPSSGQQAQVAETIPSETTKTYSDPAGFSFSYPDNLSLTKNDLTDASYAEVQLSAKGLMGSLILKITDSKFASIDEWAKSIKDVVGTPKEVKLGNLKALEIKVSSGLKLASVDQGVLFSLDVPNSQNDFWMKVYNKILAEFTFAPPTNADSQGTVSSSSDDVSFEGEEVVE